MTDITEVNPLPAHYRRPNCLYSEFKETGQLGSGLILPPKIAQSAAFACLKMGRIYSLLHLWALKAIKNLILI